jgi:hypothetical protein
MTTFAFFLIAFPVILFLIKAVVYVITFFFAFFAISVWKCLKSAAKNISCAVSKLHQRAVFF